MTTYPIKVVQYVCGECPHVETKEYAVQSDSGMSWYCAHPETLAAHGRRREKDYRLAPSWCPLLPEKKETKS